MARGRQAQDDTTLRMALIGYELERSKIEEKIREVQAALGTPGTFTTQAPKKRRTMSAAARKRIAAAQKKRWAELKKRTGKA